jgi:hypothetical protein
VEQKLLIQPILPIELFWPLSRTISFKVRQIQTIANTETTQENKEKTIEPV